MLKLKFEGNQQHQLDAINSIIGLFEGRPKLDVRYALTGNDTAVGNLAEYEDGLDPSWLEGNLDVVQRANGIEQTAVRFARDSGLMLDVAAGRGGGAHSAPGFTLEMETGTGKTYVYLRSIYELRIRFGLSKFVIVVPSVAIYEGVRKAFDITRDHLRALYGNETVDLIEYDGEQLGRVGGFARSANASVLLMTLDSFNKASNKFYKASERLPGEWLPFEYVQNTRPIVILDEPQRMGSDTARKAIRSLRPLLTLRFSATHRESPNLIYKLTPVHAYRQNLVKKIQVVGVSEQDDSGDTTLSLLDVTRTGGVIRALVHTPVTKDGRTTSQTITLAQGDDLWQKSGRDTFKDAGYVVEQIRFGPEGFVEFANGVSLGRKDVHGDTRISVFRAQIAQTIKFHLRAQTELRPRGIKVLSLIFIDRVASYTDPDGVVKRLFDEEFSLALQQDAQAKQFAGVTPEDLRTAYFAKKKKAKSEVEEVIEDADSQDFRKAEQAAYKLIMQDKERLLSFDERRCFVFAHSALREGWDNPNVFQICTLRESASDIDRRQSIGRGLRLCVNQDGERVYDESANVLTVIANESYRDFAEGLQTEYVKDGDAAPPAPKRPRDNSTRRNDAVFNGPFRLLWRKLQQVQHYRLHVDSEKLVADAATRLNLADFPRPMIVISTGALVVLQECAITVKKIHVATRKAELLLQLVDDTGSPFEYTGAFDEGDDLAKKVRNSLLKPFGRFKVTQMRNIPHVAFGNQEVEPMSEGQTYRFSPGSGTVRVRETVVKNDARHQRPVFNIIDRAAKELGITKPTILRVFRAMRDDKKRLIFGNPEGFANVFINELRNVLADHLTDRIEFETASEIGFADVEALFPPVDNHPQKEIVPASQHGLYDKMQVDSEVERAFVERLNEDGRIEFYFKFPPKFRIDLPKLIGDYNPDWGIARIDEDGQPVIYKIRETKGTEDINRLRFAHEKRKVRCAKKYFKALGIDYRPITGTTKDWWKPEPEQPALSISP